MGKFCVSAMDSGQGQLVLTYQAGWFLQGPVHSSGSCLPLNLAYHFLLTQKSPAPSLIHTGAQATNHYRSLSLRCPYNQRQTGVTTLFLPLLQLGVPQMCLVLPPQSQTPPKAPKLGQSET